MNGWWSWEGQRVDFSASITKYHKREEAELRVLGGDPPAPLVNPWLICECV